MCKNMLLTVVQMIVVIIHDLYDVAMFELCTHLGMVCVAGSRRLRYVADHLCSWF